MFKARTCPALLIAATASGQGKTTLVAALARWHHRQGRRVRVFKTGPDFLDPMILACAAATEVEPLDLWMVGAQHCQRKLYAAAQDADLILIEGAMGLFDGVPSSADLAQTLGIAVAGLIDARGMGQTFGALALGLARYRPALHWHGIIANRVASDRHAQMLRQGCLPELPLLALVPRLPAAASLPSRHLGLVQAAELADLTRRLDAAADALNDSALTQLPPSINIDPPLSIDPLPPLLAGRHIAVARDAAFSFLYPDNLRLLTELGARLSFFSPLVDHSVNADALYLPGGYPELHLSTLAANQALHHSIRAHATAGRPIYAECGGMLYLLESLTDHHGTTAALLGLLPGQATMQPRLVGLGMQSLDTQCGCLRGHSFHHSRLESPLTPTQYAQRQHGSHLGEAWYQQGAIRASYLHLYFYSAPKAAAALFLP